MSISSLIWSLLALRQPAGEVRWCADVEQIELRAALEERRLDAGRSATRLRLRLEREAPGFQFGRHSRQVALQPGGIAGLHQGEIQIPGETPQPVEDPQRRAAIERRMLEEASAP
jgi:hypothetical protein